MLEYELRRLHKVTAKTVESSAIHGYAQAFDRVDLQRKLRAMVRETRLDVAATEIQRVARGRQHRVRVLLLFTFPPFPRTCLLSIVFLFPFFYLHQYSLFFSLSFSLLATINVMYPHLNSFAILPLAFPSYPKKIHALLFRYSKVAVRFQALYRGYRIREAFYR